ncbi:GntR family transcriptional regulator [Erythrobacter sp. KY5]|uniref:FadR/GntR family transcriptional regulator n=1 Tax=Erythrobacter sp. KY5 TaxID=2011159 RepID=UPI000DBEF710|nr:FCD domain-containing protein [Erythrobacter sp. KY5]AWW74432.1 GntR family transcriptional regulator [Erythrobacter sp. KY5]
MSTSLPLSGLDDMQNFVVIRPFRWQTLNMDILGTRQATCLFFPISGARAFEEVAEQLTFVIRSGAYEVGDRLPNIDELSRLMSVSKPTVGQGLKLLVDAGLVRVIRGVNGGAEVLSNAPPTKPLSDASPTKNFSFQKLVEARKPIEIEIALLASKNGSEKDFRKLQETVQLLAKHQLGEQSEKTFYDQQFHYLLGRISRNQVLARYQHQILERLYYEMARRDFFSKEDIQSVIDWHTDTLNALRKGDRKKIVKVVSGHLAPLEEYAKSLANTFSS